MALHPLLPYKYSTFALANIYSYTATSVPLGAIALYSHSASGRGAICTRSLASELADSLRLIIELR